MEATGYTASALVLVGASLLASAILVYWRTQNEGPFWTFRNTPVIVFAILVPIASILYSTYSPELRTYDTQGTIVEVETNGDGSDEDDYSVIDTDSSNVALVVPRSTLPSVAPGDHVKLTCSLLAAGSETVYFCDKGSVSKAELPE